MCRQSRALHVGQEIAMESLSNIPQEWRRRQMLPSKQWVNRVHLIQTQRRQLAECRATFGFFFVFFFLNKKYVYFIKNYLPVVAKIGQKSHQAGHMQLTRLVLYMDNHTDCMYPLQKHRGRRCDSHSQ